MSRAASFTGLFAALGLLAATPALAAPAQIGRVDKVERQAVAVVEGATRDMQAGGPVFFGDMIRTGAASRLEAAPWAVVRWLPPEMREDELDASLVELGAELSRGGGRLDGHGRVV